MDLLCVRRRRAASVCVCVQDDTVVVLAAHTFMMVAEHMEENTRFFEAPFTRSS